MEECLMKKKIGSGRKRLVNVEIVCFPRNRENETKLKSSNGIWTTRQSVNECTAFIVCSYL